MSDTISTFYSNNCDTPYNSHGWLSSAVARPALALNDLAAMVWPNDVTAPAAGCQNYFRDIMAGQMPIVEGKESCALNQAGGLLSNWPTLSTNKRPRASV